MVFSILLIMAFCACVADRACNASSDKPDVECYVDLRAQGGELWTLD